MSNKYTALIALVSFTLSLYIGLGFEHSILVTLGVVMASVISWEYLLMSTELTVDKDSCGREKK